jgi:hypothetical protein
MLHSSPTPPTLPSPPTPTPTPESYPESQKKLRFRLWPLASDKELSLHDTQTTKTTHLTHRILTHRTPSQKEYPELLLTLPPRRKRKSQRKERTRWKNISMWQVHLRRRKSHPSLGGRHHTDGVVHPPPSSQSRAKTWIPVVMWRGAHQIKLSSRRNGPIRTVLVDSRVFCAGVSSPELEGWSPFVRVCGEGGGRGSLSGRRGWVDWLCREGRQIIGKDWKE